MNKVPEINKLSELHTKETIGFPMTPGSWHSTPEYKNVTKITMTSGVNKWNEIVEQISPDILAEHMKNNIPLVATTYDGRKIILNLHYMIKAEDFTMVVRQFNNKNSNFTIGIHICRWLLPLNEKIRFSDNFYY